MRRTGRGWSVGCQDLGPVRRDRHEAAARQAADTRSLRDPTDDRRLPVTVPLPWVPFPDAVLRAVRPGEVPDPLARRDGLGAVELLRSWMVDFDGPACRQIEHD